MLYQGYCVDIFVSGLHGFGDFIKLVIHRLIAAADALLEQFKKG